MNVKSDVNSENLKNVGQKNSASKENGFSSGKSVNSFLEQLVAHSSDFTFNPETVRRIAGDIKAQIISEHEKEEFSSTRFDFSINQKLHDSLIRALEEDSIKLPIVDYTYQNYDVLFPQGLVDTPIETLKMGDNQFLKFNKPDRDYLLAAAYQTLATPSLIFDSMSLDSKSGELKPVRVYGKSFYRENKDKSRAVESVIIFKEENNIVIGTHNKDFSRFVNQIKTADQIIYADKTVSRVCELAKGGRAYVRTEGDNAQSLNRNYNKSSVLSISDLIKNKRLSVIHIELEKSSYFKEQEMDKFIFREIGSGRIFVAQGAKDEWNAFMFTDGMDFVERKDLNIDMTGHLQEDFARTVAAATADAFGIVKDSFSMIKATDIEMIIRKNAEDYDPIEAAESLQNGTQDEIDAMRLVGAIREQAKEIPKLKTYHTLTKEDVEGLEIISDDDFSDIVDSIILNDYRNIPNAIRLPNLKAELAEKLGLEKDAAFILKKNATHIRPDRKGGYGQAFDTEEYRRIPEVLRNADFAIVDNVFQNFQIVFDDENDGSKINKLVFNKDELGNYLVTIGKVDRENAFAEERNIVVAVGVAPTIQTLRTSASSTALRASTTTNNQNLSQEKPYVKSVGEQLAELDSKTWNELGIESGSDFTGHPEKIKNYASSIKDYLDANGIKELDRETFSFLEAINYHTLNNILGLHGVYGEEFRRRAIERADSPYSNYDRNTALEIVNGIDREEILDKGIERMLENGGVSEAAAEAEMNARDNLRADYLDADGNPHWFDEEEEQAEDQEIEEDSSAPAESTITEGNLYPDDVNSAKTKLGDIVRETFLSLSDDEKEAGTTTEQKYTHYEKWHRPMIDEIMASVIAGDHDLLRKISDFDLNKASHKEGNSYYSEDEAFKRDVNYKLLPELYEIIQDKIIEKYNQDKTPYVMLNWSESPVFPIQNKVYTVKEFNELLTQADKDFHNRKEYAEKKYGSAERYWDLQDTDKLPEEDKNISFGYDKTSFKLLNFPSIENQEDTYSYEANRYDIGDGNGSVFDFIRATCSHDQVIESCNKVEKELYYPDITKEQQAFIENAVKEEKIALKQNLVAKMAAFDVAHMEYDALQKKWLVESSEAERIDELIERTLSEIKTTYDNSISNLYTKVLNEYPYASTKNIYDSQFMLYTANEAKKMVLSELYLPSRDNKKYTSNDWEKFRKIFEQFPAIVNMTEYVENILQEKCNEKGYSVSENIDHNVANKIKTDSKQIATNYVLEKLAAAGIEVVTDKTIFEELLNTSELLQKMTDNKPNVNVSDIYFTADKNEVLAFAKELDDFASQAKLGDKSINPLRLINVGSISPVMKVLGIADVPVEIEQSTVLKALREEPLYPNDRQGHKLSLDELKAIPHSLADPVMVFRSDSPTRKTKDSFVFFTERKDEKNRSIIIPVAVNKKFGRLVINKVSSIYGRNQEVGYVKDNIQRGNLVYFDKKRSLIWERECKVQFLAQVLPAEGSINNILSKDSLVKFLDSKKQNFVRDSKTYGFAYRGKIYLDPDLMNSEVAVHEYTHLWDNYTMKTNPELWEKGKEVFKRTSLWNEVKASPDYADIADDDNLVLSECHARIAGKVAAQVLEKIAKENGEIARDKVINWDLEVSAYVYSELSERGERLSASDFQKLNEFIVSPVKDLLNGRDVPEISVTPDKPLSMKLSPERKPGGNRGIEIFSGNVASIISGARDGSLPALPKDGFSPDGGITIRPAAVRSYLKGQVFTGLNQLVAQKKAVELGLEPDARGSINVITYRQAGEKNIRKGTPHFDLTSYDGANNRMNYYHLYSVKGIIDESKLPPPHKPLVIPSAVINAEDPDIAPVDYLASYEAATKAGCQFRTNRKTVEAVREKLVAMEKELLKTENYNSLSASIGSRSKKIILDKARNINAELHPRTRCNDRGVDR